MFKQLKIYYVFVALPFVMLLVGATIFFDGIKVTIVRNPHPQINYTIFAIILIGGCLVLLNAHRLVREARSFLEYFAAVRAKKDGASLQKLAGGYSGESACLLQMMAATEGRTISHQEQVAIENELGNARSSLLRRNALPQYLTGLLVGMGLLGTFIGLLATLNDITVLISSFADLDMQNASPLLVFRTMIERMKAPMQSMGIAFSASMFGLLGSIILGLMMVGLRRLQGDMFSVLSSEVARHIEFALSRDPLQIATVAGQAPAGDVSNVLLRIDERYAEATRAQQRALAVLTDDLQRQRADLLRALAEQTEASNGVRGELQQLGRQFGSLGNAMEKGNSEVSAQLAELTVQLTAHARETQKLLTQQVDEQKQLKDHIDSYHIEERLAEGARTQQRTLTTVMDDLQQQRAEVVQALAEQTEANNRSRGELRQIGSQLESIYTVIEKGDAELAHQLTELTVHSAADARQAHRLLDLLRGELSDQMKLLDSQFDRGQQLSEKIGQNVAGQIAELTGQLAADGQAARERLDTLIRQLQSDLERLSGQVDTGCQMTGKGNEELVGRVQELTARLVENARISQQQLDSLGSWLRSELKGLASQVQSGAAVLEQGNHGLSQNFSELMTLLSDGARSSLGHLDTISSQLRDELQQLDRQLGSGHQLMQRGNDEIAGKIGELIGRMASAAQPSVEGNVEEERAEEKIA
ncbi:MAG: hypothetical protein RQ723_05480 [Desulfuromonadales bacterium]|nr:hypothetical protein [Desulfuromonadales bacterium]